MAAVPPPFAIDPDSVVRTQLSNGLTVLVRADHSAPVVAIVTFVSAGYFDETDDVVGIAHVRRAARVLPELLSSREHGVDHCRRRRSTYGAPRSGALIWRAAVRRADAHAWPARGRGGGLPLPRMGRRHRAEPARLGLADA